VNSILSGNSVPYPNVPASQADTISRLTRERDLWRAEALAAELTMERSVSSHGFVKTWWTARQARIDAGLE
jgi:hypothetical protein